MLTVKTKKIYKKLFYFIIKAIIIFVYFYDIHTRKKLIILKKCFFLKTV